MNKNFYALAFCATMMGTGISAQVVYTDIEDGTPTGIDFNNDGTNEFDISAGMSTGDYITYYNYGADNNIHAIGTLATENWDVPSCVENGFVIDGSLNWEGQGDCAVNGWGASNPTLSTNQDTYLAVRFNLGTSDVYYGWIRINKDANGVITYKDFAYNSTSESSINAGQTASTAGIKTLNMNTLKVYPNPANEKITIETMGNTMSHLIISNVLGETVKFVAIKNEVESIAIQHLPRGIYMVNMYNNNQMLQQQKLVIQ